MGFKFWQGVLSPDSDPPDSLTLTLTPILLGCRTASAVSPFNKSCNFSKPMTAYDKVVIDE